MLSALACRINAAVIPDATFPEAKLRLEKSVIRDPGRMCGSGSRFASDAINRLRDWALLATGMTQLCVVEHETRGLDGESFLLITSCANTDEKSCCNMQQVVAFRMCPWRRARLLRIFCDIGLGPTPHSPVPGHREADGVDTGYFVFVRERIGLRPVSGVACSSASPCCHGQRWRMTCN